MVAAVGLGQPSVLTDQQRIADLERRVTDLETATSTNKRSIGTHTHGIPTAWANQITRAVLAANHDHAHEHEAVAEHDHGPAFPLVATGTSDPWVGFDAVAFADLPAGLYDVTIRYWNSSANKAYEFSMFAHHEGSDTNIKLYGDGPAARGERTATVQIRLHDGHARSWADRSDDIADMAAGDITLQGQNQQQHGRVHWEVTLTPAEKPAEAPAN